MNPAAAGRQVLLYPGGQYMRVLPPLLQPGEPSGPIHLHMPARHRFARARSAIAAAPQAEAPVTPPAPRAATYSDFGNVAVAQPKNPAPAPARSEPKPPPQRVARVEPPPTRTATRNPETYGGAKRNVILFAPNASDPSVSALQTVKSLAGSVSAALTDGTSRVQLMAYGGQRGDKSSDTRRLSLKRALIVRQVLIDEGVPAERIDVRAMGGTDDDGPLDRVDVFLKS
ncbi:MAG: OmpA family protein [Rhizomicrobium sp.]